MDFLKKLIARTEDVENCSICILRTSIECAPWIFPYQLYCRHSPKRFSETFHIRKNRLWCWIHHCLLLVGIAMWLNNIYYLCTIYEEDEVRALILLSDALFGINAINVYACILSKERYLTTVIEITSRIVDGNSGCGYTTCLSSNYRKRLNTRCQVERYIVYLVHVVFIIVFVIFLKFYDLQEDGMSILFNCSSTIVLLSYGVILIQQQDFHFHMARVILVNIIDDMKDPVIVASTCVLRNKLEVHLQLISALRFSMDNLVAFMGPCTVIYILTAIIIFIENIYLYALSWGEYYSLYIGYQQIRTILLVILLLEVIFRMDVYNISQDVLSFLYRYPLSKLTREQADQVEMLTFSLQILKPVIIASDCVSINRRLVGTIGGTVVTYALVAFQFRAARIKI